MATFGFFFMPGRSWRGSSAAQITDPDPHLSEHARDGRVIGLIGVGQDRS